MTRYIRDSVTGKFGCCAEWDRWSNQHRPICNEMKQLFQYNGEFNVITSLIQEDIKNHTGCFLLRQYKEYKIVDTPIQINPHRKNKSWKYN